MASFHVTQIPSIVNDAYEDVMGKGSAPQVLDATALVSMGKSLSSFDLIDGWYKALTNRIIKTVLFARRYNVDARSILRDEHAYGAFVQKIYVWGTDAVDNPAFKGMPNNGNITTQNPYDVTNVLETEVSLFGTEGTWAYEFVKPTIQIQKAFTDPSSMASFVDGQTVAVLNRIESAKESLINLACNVGIADCITNGKARNLLAEYNTLTTSTLTVADCLMDKDFLKWASKEINKTVKFIKKPSVNWNIKGYETFTPSDKLITEVLSEFSQACEYYLESDTFHNNLVALPNYSDVPFWQYNNEDFDLASKINVKHSDINSGTAVEQSGIIAVLRDEEFACAYFGDEYQWSVPNPRQRTSIHGYEYKKGYAIDEHANAFVFYIADVEVEEDGD